MKSGAWKVPETRAKMLASRPVWDGPSSPLETAKVGVGSANAWSRIETIQPVSACVLAVVKSQARISSAESTPLSASVWKRPWKPDNRAAIAAAHTVPQARAISASVPPSRSARKASRGRIGDAQAGRRRGVGDQEARRRVRQDAALLDEEVTRRGGVDLQAAERGDGRRGPARVRTELRVREGHVRRARSTREPVPHRAGRHAGTDASAVRHHPRAEVPGAAEAGDGGVVGAHRDAHGVALAPRVTEPDGTDEAAAALVAGLVAARHEVVGGNRGRVEDDGRVVGVEYLQPEPSRRGHERVVRHAGAREA